MENKKILLNFYNMEKAVIKGKKIECLIGILFLIPPTLGVFAFVLQLFGADIHFSMMFNLSSDWTTHILEQGGGMSAAPLYLGLMAIAGAYLIKDSFQFLFYRDNKQDAI